ncbi:hypothetical protein CEF21_01475 [Bacillus sp. FJAT-42376]|uniref:hypothetical protein n=1 Tax=Bacillus sp. FJAT-42376 TaxID=2014076 RepID=UPI000F501282|nr:hypothetical protein [Bacillus sp. FJAT-42376]AZB41115.1 hypothetical protein CEF21_01475 [Bacillus sp. FJAT-42376]
MLVFERTLRLRDIEIFMIYKDSWSLGYLVIEDLRRPLNHQDIQETFEHMTEDDLDSFKNIIKVDFVSEEPLFKEDKIQIEVFADGLTDKKDHCATRYTFKVDSPLFVHLGVTEDISFYKRLLFSVGSSYELSPVHLNRLMYLSQD